MAVNLLQQTTPPIDYSQSGLTQISALAEQLMQAQYAWGQQQFAKNSQLTDQVVGDLMNLYGTMSGIGNTLMSQYNQFFVPEYQSLVTDANNYASRARIQQAMGAAESGVAQNFNGQRDAALADLQSFGIDPSSGRYAQLDAAERTQEAAAAAGAGFQAEQATEAVGRGLRSEALQLGSVMPSQATAAYNASQGAATAAENAKLANAQEGVNMMGSPAQLGGVGQQLRYQQQMPNPPNLGAGGGGGSKAGGGTSGEYPRSGTASPNTSTGQGFQPQHSGYTPDSPGGAMRSAPPGTGAGITETTPQDTTNPGEVPPPGPIQFYDQPSAPENMPPGSDTAGQEGSPFYGPPTDSANPQYDPSSAGQEGSPFYGPPTDSTPSFDTGQSGFDQSSYDQSSSYDNSSSGSSFGDTGASVDNSGYAQGGAIPMHGKLDDGGQVSYDKSPSGGRDTDDVAARLHGSGEPIRLNAGEFIIPRHTVRWLGEKYFQDLIKKSKQARDGAGARPTMKPALPAHGSNSHATR